MTGWPHWIIVPVVLPLLAAGLILAARLPLRAARRVSLASALALAAVALLLLVQAQAGGVQAYLVGNWRAPFGIALVLDRLAAFMLMLTAGVALGALVFALGDDDRRGAHFHALFQLQLMGLNGAFLTGDLFNLFVFFEVLLAASYGLLLHGGGRGRLSAAFHYVTFNLVGSALFLVAVAMLYGLTGTLNMADLAQRVASAPPENAALIRSAALMLLVVFGVKAALLPLYFWLPDTYGTASAPVAALFAVMTKVGVYAIARVATLIFGAAGGVAANVTEPWLAWLALATLLLGAAGALAARRLRVLVAYVVVASAGTLLVGLGLATEGSVAASLFYLAPSTLVVAGLFLAVARVAAARGAAADLLQSAPFGAGRAGLGALFFLLACAAASLPPFAGFMAKASLLDAAIVTPLAAATWAVLLVSALGLVIALARAGSTVFWETPAPALVPASASAPPPRLAAPASTGPAQRAGIALMVAGVLGMTIFAGPLSGYARATSAQLFERRGYIDAVLGAQSAPPAWTPRGGMVGK